MTELETAEFQVSDATFSTKSNKSCDTPQIEPESAFQSAAALRESQIQLSTRQTESHEIMFDPSEDAQARP